MSLRCHDLRQEDFFAAANRMYEDLLLSAKIVCKLHWHYTCIDDLKKGEREWIENGKMFNKTNYCRTCEGALEQVKNRVDEHDVKIEILSRKNDELSEEL